MGRRALALAVAALVVVGAGVTLVLIDGRGPSGGPPPKREVSRVPPGSAAPAKPLGARLLHRTQLRSRPGGRVVRTLSRLTEFHSSRVLAVVARRGDWLGVLSEHMPNSRAGWIPTAAAQLVHEPYALDVDLSSRRLSVRHEGRVVRHVRIAIGRPEVPTPRGRFGVTDSLRIGGGSGAYGCCAIALTARQPNIPQGWSGGDRIAIHGTSAVASIGTPASGGCLRARDSDMRWLMRRITLGAQVRIRA